MLDLGEVLAHPARIAIIQYLVKSQACVCGDLADEMGLARATISQHLKELKIAGLIHKYFPSHLSRLLNPYGKQEVC